MFLASRGSSFRTFNLHCSWCCAVWRPENVSPYIIIVQITFSGPFLSGPISIKYYLLLQMIHSIVLILSQFENRVPLKPVLGGMESIAPLHYCTRTIIPNLLFSFLWCFPCFQRIFSQNLLQPHKWCLYCTENVLNCK